MGSGLGLDHRGHVLQRVEPPQVDAFPALDGGDRVDVGRLHEARKPTSVESKARVACVAWVPARKRLLGRGWSNASGQPEASPRPGSGAESAPPESQLAEARASSFSTQSGKLAALLGHHRDALGLAQPAAGVGDVVQRGLAEQQRAEDLGEQHVRVAVLEHLGGEITR